MRREPVLVSTCAVARKWPVGWVAAPAMPARVKSQTATGAFHFILASCAFERDRYSGGPE
jgi:hypothetical protein